MKKNIKYKKPKVIAEIGCNHMGNMDTSKELILSAKGAGVEYVKFQKRNNRLLPTEEQYNSPHPVPSNSYGDTYGEHRESLEFSIDQHSELKLFCEENDITYSTSVWDQDSAEQITKLNPSFIKVPSACNNNYELLKILRDSYNGQVQISFGMTKKSEMEEVIKFFEKTGQAKPRLLIYSCTSGYPVKPSEVSLLEICFLNEKYGERVSEIGFSGHHLGIALDISAYTLGASWIERHFTKDRTWKGTDHAASLEPSGLRKLVRDLNSTFEALNYKNKEILDVEQIQREKLKNRK